MSAPARHPGLSLVPTSRKPNAKRHPLPDVQRPVRSSDELLRLGLQERAHRPARARAGRPRELRHFRDRGPGVPLLRRRAGLRLRTRLLLFVSCETQDEVDALWDQFAAGGEIQRCGWLKDKFGVSWQIIPSILGKGL